METEMITPELREIRKKAGMSLDEVGELCGVSRQTLSMMEKGETDIGIAVLRNLALIYKYELVVQFKKQQGTQCLLKNIVDSTLL
jgi:transcriptional regulator with XRE-family HTH domain